MIRFGPFRKRSSPILRSPQIYGPRILRLNTVLRQFFMDQVCGLNLWLPYLLAQLPLFPFSVPTCYTCIHLTAHIWSVRIRFLDFTYYLDKNWKTNFQILFNKSVQFYLRKITSVRFIRNVIKIRYRQKKKL